MALTPYDKDNIREIWKKVRGNTAKIGGEALKRTFLTFPTTKTYFLNFDLSPGSAQVRYQGRKVVDALTDAVDNVGDLPAAMRVLSELHGYRLHVDPVNFRFLTHGMLVTLASKYPGDFSPAVHTSMEKFLDNVSTELTSRYH